MVVQHLPIGFQYLVYQAGCPWSSIWRGVCMKLSPKIEEHTLRLDGSRVSYTARGPVNAERAYVGLNGLMGGGDSFWPVIEGLPDEWRIVLPDLPGCGKS